MSLLELADRIANADGLSMHKLAISDGPWTTESAIEQIQKCAFECTGGPLENNIAWRWLVSSLLSTNQSAADRGTP